MRNRRQTEQAGNDQDAGTYGRKSHVMLHISFLLRRGMGLGNFTQTPLR